jgi:signal transduction histidine kinase
MNYFLISVIALLTAATVALLLDKARRAADRLSTPHHPAAGPPNLSAEGPSAVEILNTMAEGVIVLNPSFVPTFANAAAVRLLGLQGAPPKRLPAPELLATARRAAAEGPTEELLTLWYPTRATLWVRAAPRSADGEIVLFLQDVTQEALAQRIRREFVAHASHEMKSPVAGIQALAEAIGQAVNDDPGAAVRLSDRLMKEAERLGRLVRDLLDLSKLEEVAAPMEERVNLAEVAARELDRLRPVAAAKQIVLEERIAPDVWVLGDDDQLGLMVGNLLDNALRYTPDDGHVLIEVGNGGREAVVKVADDGVGIPLESQERIFERFYRVDRARSRDRGGTGLGLAIVKHVAELHGGRVELVSSLGEGSTFTARIPVLARRTPKEEEAAS